MCFAAGSSGEGAFLLWFCGAQISIIILGKAVRRDVLYCAAGKNDYIEKNIVPGGCECACTHAGACAFEADSKVPEFLTACASSLCEELIADIQANCRKLDVAHAHGSRHCADALLSFSCLC